MRTDLRGEVGQRAVEGDEDGDLHERGEAPRQGVHVVVRVQLRHLLLLRLRVRLVLGLDFLHLDWGVGG